jgi:TonB family protein
LELKACQSMAYSRQEIAPSDQIKALRHARDRYAEMADRIHNDINSTLDATERQAREDDARRIAKAYDRSLSNSLAQLSGMEGSHRTQAHSFGGSYRIAVLIALALSASLPFAYFYATPGSLNRLRAYAPIKNFTSKENRPLANSRRPITSPVKTAQNSAPAKTDFADKVDLGTKKTAVALSHLPPKKIARPHVATTKVVTANRREKSLSQPTDKKPINPKTPEFAKIPLPGPSENTLPTLSANTSASPVEPPAPPILAMPLQTPASIRPEPIAGTHTLPGYPPLSALVGEAGTTKISVAISPQGQAVDCRISQSSGSDRLDRVACAHVTEYWRWKPVSREGLATAPRTSVTIVWNLRRADSGR